MIKHDLFPSSSVVITCNIRRLSLEGGSLIINGALQSDEGRYQCIARNIADTRVSRRVLLSVYGEITAT